MENKKIELITTWPLFMDVLLYKDVGTFIKYFSHEYNLNAEILMFDNPSEQMTKLTEFDGVTIKKIINKSGYQSIPKIKHVFRFYKYLLPFKNYIKENAKNWNYVMLFHANGVTFTIINWVLRYNKKIKIYVKGDISSFNNFIQKKIINRIVRKGCYFSTENKNIYEHLVEENKEYKNLIANIPNGIDDYFVNTLDILPRRENLIISTARFGSTQKNSELLLEILDAVNYKDDWKVILAGPIETEEQDFQKYIDEKFAISDNLRQHVAFIGNVSNREELYKLYSRAKVFMFTSRWEGSSLSFLEASYFGDYIIATDVGCASEILTGTGYGFIAPESKKDMQNIPLIKSSMIEKLQSIIDGRTDIDSSRELFMKGIREKYSMIKIINQPFFQKFIGIYDA